MPATLEERERRVIAEIQKIRFFPLSVVGGEGCHLIDERGQRILDLSGTWGAATLGYNHPAVQEAVAQSLSSLASASNVSSTNEQAVALAEELLAFVPGLLPAESLARPLRLGCQRGDRARDHGGRPAGGVSSRSSAGPTAA